MIIELEIGGARVIISGENLAVSVTEDDQRSKRKAVEFPSGFKIKELREKLGESQTEFADRFGVRQPTVCRWERGKELPSGPSAVLIKDLIEDFLQ